MKIFKKQITDVCVQHMWSTQWNRSKYVLLVTCAKFLFGIKIMENTEIYAVFDSKGEARKYAKRMRQKYNVPRKYKNEQ